MHPFRFDRSRLLHVGKTAVFFAVGGCSGMAIAANAATPPTQLPVPCSPGACNTNSKFVTSGAATAVQQGAKLTVNQTSNAATLNWASFNISADGKVVFNQPSASSVALNRIYDANPSSIFGSLTANGQIYLINANGFLFGATSKVNVAGMIASSLNITDSTFQNGLLAPLVNFNPALEQFTGNNQHFSDDGPPGATKLTNLGTIVVQNGAELNATSGGRLLLAAPTIQNAGSLSAPDGQVILAAGQNVYLQASSDNSLRGLIVQVDGGTSAADQLAGAGIVNQSTGVLSAARGNVSLASLMINQDGRISATTSVSANGSIILEAAEKPLDFSNPHLQATVGGQLTIGPNSQIEILPEYADTATAVDAQAQLPSTINLIGKEVLIQGGTIHAPSGTLAVLAESNPSANLQSGTDPDARIHIDPGTTIDLSGSDATLPMDANLVTVQLRSNELADDPTQRNGALRGQTVTVDVRADNGAGTQIADLTSAIAAIGKNIAQRTEAGGTATFLSGGDIVFSPGASINVSGGATTYLGGTIQTTKLVGANGQIYDIGTANPLFNYTGVINPTVTQSYDKWGVQEVVPTTGFSHYESTYQQGASAGTVQFAASAMALDGSLSANATYGPYQRGPFGSSATLGGTLIIGRAGSAANTNIAPNGQIDFSAPSIQVVSTPTPIAVSDNASLPPQTLQLPADFLTSDGFGHIQLYSNTTFELPASLPLQLPAGTSLTVQASRIDINSNITDYGGALNFQNELTVANSNPLTAPSLGPGAPRIGIGVGDGVTLDVSGQWTNDSLFAGGIGVGPTLQNAGSVNLQSTQPGAELAIGSNVTIKADGGAWLQSGGTLSYGHGGAITLDASPANGALKVGQSFGLEAFGAYTASGGTLSLLAPRIDISQGTGTAWTRAQSVDELNSPGGVLDLYAPLFSNYGFSSVNLTATAAATAVGADTLTVEPGTSIVAQASTLQLNTGYQSRVTGGTLEGNSHIVQLPSNLRPVESVSLNALRLTDDALLGKSTYGDITIGKGTSIQVDPGASIGIKGEGDIAIAGLLQAPGGSVSIQLLSPYLFNQPPGAAADVDPGYIEGQGITLTQDGVIDVSGGTRLLTPNNQSLLLGSVQSGGSVNITAQRGSVTLDSGSTINFAGGSNTLDVPVSTGGYLRETVATPGGSLTVGATESMSLLGNLKGQAGVGSAGSPAAGTLEIDLTRSGFDIINNQPDPTAPLTINLVTSTAGDSPSVLVNSANIGVAQLNASGIDALVLNAGGAGAGQINFETSQPLAMNRSIVFDAANVSVADGVTGNIAAPFVQIGNPLAALHSPIEQQPAPLAGTGTLKVNAGQLILQGEVTLQGISAATFASKGDIQLQGNELPTDGSLASGYLLSSGDVTLQAARVYPDTFTSFSLESRSTGGNGTVRIDQILGDNGKPVPSLGSPLSAGGSVQVIADNIEVGGSLYAPFGTIALQANNNLTLANGSTVSVSGAGLDVPFGQTIEAGAHWIYGQQTELTGAPQKQVSLTAPNIAIDGGAKVDLKGGGDLYAYEWVPGTGGPKDALAGGTSHTPGLYAILPMAPGQLAPFDPQESAGFNSNQVVYLSGGAGVAPGYYALLPPRYALEPGAMLLQVQSTYTSANPGQIGSLADGTPVVAGYIGYAGTNLSAGASVYQGFAIYPGSYGQQLAAYNISQASTYFPAQAAATGATSASLPADAGILTFIVTQPPVSFGNSLNLQGTVLTAAASGGRDALVNISAPNLEISTDGTSSDPTFLAVSGSVLQSWNAGALSLGGVTSAGTSALSATVAASNVVVDSGVNLSADQILLMASQSIDVKGSLSSTSGKAGTTLATPPASQTLTLSDPNASVVGVSDLGLPLVARSGNSGTATVTLESGSSLSTGGALVIDAPGTVNLAGTLNGKGASWSLGSSSIGIGYSGSTPAPDSLNIDANLLNSLQSAGALRLVSQGNINVYSPTQLGVSSLADTPTLNALTLTAGAINNVNGSDVTLGAGKVTLGGIAGSNPTPVVGVGTLGIVANNLALDANTLGVSGFADTVLQVAGTLSSTTAVSSALPTTGSQPPAATVVRGLSAAGDVTLNAAQLSAGAGTQTSITTTGKLTLGSDGAPSVSPPLIGGALNLTANSILDNAIIAMPSGVVSLNATGGDLELGGSAAINVNGTIVTAVNRTAATPGGIINLTTAGNLSLDAGSALNVSGNQNAPAGSISLVSGKTATLAGTLTGTATNSGSGGSFYLNAGSLNGGLTPLAAKLGSGGFDNAINIRAHSGDLSLAAGGQLKAGSVTLTADTGLVDIAGAISAPSGARAGLIDLSSGVAVRLDAGGQLRADGTGGSEIGGEILLNATCATCFIQLDSGSLISATGTKQMGQLVLRAPIDASGSDVAVNVGSTGLGADVSHLGQVIVDAVMPITTTAATVNGDLANGITNASGFLNTATPVIAARLGGQTSPLSVQAEVELIDPTVEDLTLSGLVDLSNYSNPAYYGGTQAPQVINLNVRAAGSININGTFSDGFITDPTGNSSLLALSNTPSASFTFVAGADTASANSLSVLKGSSANLTLLASPAPADGSTDGFGPSVVRTGTGDINLAAAGNIVFAAGAGGAAAVYTGGAAPANVYGPVSYADGSLIQNFGAGGGSVRINAGADVVGAPVGATFANSDGGDFSVGGWLLHQGSLGIPAQYGVNFAGFAWNVGALGGGDVVVTAGGNVNNLSAAVADSFVSSDNAVNGVATKYGAGGGLSISAVGDIGSAQVYVADGVGTLTAGGGLTAIRTSSSVGNSGNPVGSSIALGDSQVSVWARNSVQVDAIYNPSNVAELNARQDSTLSGVFLTYGADSAVNLSSTSGPVTLEIQTSPNGPMATLLGSKEVNVGSSALAILPPNLSVQSSQSDIVVNGVATLAPAADGQLSLFAARDIAGIGPSGNRIIMSDAFLSALPTVDDPSLQGSEVAPFQGVIHGGDSQPALITAGRDVYGMYFSIPKVAQVVAGRDLLNLAYKGQNDSAGDTTLISAGRDLVSVGESTSANIRLGGQGSLDVITGRNMNLGFGNGIVTTGNLANANLPSAQGADISLMVGYGTNGADLSGFMQKIVDPSATYQGQLVNYVESLTGSSGLTYDQARAEFTGLTTAQQGTLIDQVFFNELLLSGRAANAGGSAGFSEGYAAIDALFPNSRNATAANPSPYAGNLTLTSSQIYTDSGGNINILVPGGKIDVGLANPPPTIAPKPASSLGIVAQGAGDVNIYTLADVNVNKSRVFTLGGGNILIWSTEGSIDAGNGSKSSLSVPPPSVSVDSNGNVTLNFGASLAAGSGIRTIQTNPSVAPGNVDLDAPVGTVNAGDAGIGAAGNINIAAAHVIGVDNINFGGSAAGVPSDVSNIGASLSGASAVAAGSTNTSTSAASEAAAAAKEVAPIAQTALSWLDVFVTGLGEENCKQDDIECLKRQKATQ